PVLFKRPALVSPYVTTALVVTADFTAYTYTESFVQSVGGFSQPTTSWLLLLFGLAPMPGSLSFSALHTRFPATLTHIAIGCLCLCLGLMFWASLSVYALVAVFAVWGLAMLCFGVQMQSQVIRMAPDATDVATALHSAIYNIGIGGGAL